MNKKKTYADYKQNGRAKAIINGKLVPVTKEVLDYLMRRLPIK